MPPEGTQIVLQTGLTEKVFYLNIGTGAFMSLIVIGGLYLIVSGLKTGSVVMAVVRGRGGGIEISRERNPIAFWFCIVIYFLGAVVAAGIAYLSYSNHVFCLDRQQSIENYKMFPSMKFSDTKLKCTR